MIYQAPKLAALDDQMIKEIQDLQEGLRFHLATPRRWYGTLSRVMMSRAVQASTSIEGYHTTVEETAAIIDGEEPLGITEDTRKAVSGYRDAMTYVLQLTSQKNHKPKIDASLLGSLHFMIVGHDLSANPGQWRPGAVWVRDANGRVVYEAPDRAEMEPLIEELIVTTNDTSNPAFINAAMSHLNLTLIHPFSDGNGQMARCLQSFVLARSDNKISAEFVSIEEYLGRNTPAYYNSLTATAAGAWSPARSARPWIEFCLKAHYHQAVAIKRRIDRIEALLDRCQQVASRYGLADRTIDALMHSALGGHLNRSRYTQIVKSTTGQAISDAMATRDLANLAKVELLEPQGEKRGRFYIPSESLRAMDQEIRAAQGARPSIDPYDRTK